MFFLSFAPLWVSILFIDIKSIIENQTEIVTEKYSVLFILILAIISLVILMISFNKQNKNGAQEFTIESVEEEKTIKALSINDIMQTVATYFGVTLADIISEKRTQTLVTPRQLAMFLSRKLTSKSLKEIALTFDKTHATVLHGAQTIQKRIDVEPDLKKSLEEIVSQMGRKPSDVLE